MSQESSSTSRLTALRSQSKRHLARMSAFYLSVVVFVFFWLLAFGFHIFALFTTWFDPVLSDTIHFVHDIALATWVLVWGLAMVVQLYQPAKRVVAMQIALLMSILDFGFVLHPEVAFDPSALLFFGPIFIAALLHPGRRELLSLGPAGRAGLDPLLLVLATLAAVPVALYVAGQLNYQFILTDEHAAFGHYGTMSYYGLSLIALAFLAGLSRRARRVAALATGFLAMMLAIASVFQPTMSGLDTTWSVIAALWALTFVVAAEWSLRRSHATVGVERVETAIGSPPSV